MIDDLLVAMGFCVVVAGVSWIYPPAAVILAGLGLMGAGIVVGKVRSDGDN